MDAGIVIRDERADDIQAITEVTVAAFAPLEISNGTEQHIVRALREQGALSVSLVAERAGEVLGHIAFSPITVTDGTAGWYGLGPVSVLPEHQRRGIGAALIEAGLARLRQLGARGCCLVGHPEYYPRFGFRTVPGLIHEGVPPEAFMALCLAGDPPQGTVSFHPAFGAEA